MRAGIQVLQTAHECGSSRNPQEACARQDTVISDSEPNTWPGAACRIAAPWMSGAERDSKHRSAPAWMGKLRPRQVKFGASKTHAHGVRSNV